MKNKVKKRVNENKSSSGLVFLWSIFIILLIACGVLYLGKDSLIEYFRNPMSHEKQKYSKKEKKNGC